MNPAWRDVAWRPVISYARHHLRGLLALAGRWCIFVVTSLELGMHVGAPRHVTEMVRRFNGGARTQKDYERMMKEENRKRREEARRDPRQRRKLRPRRERRNLEIEVLDLAKFFINVPKEEFHGVVMPDIMKRVQEKYGNKEWF